MSGEIQENYIDLLRNYLTPRLSFCMQHATESESKDPIEFIGEHLRHLSWQDKSAVF